MSLVESWRSSQTTIALETPSPNHPAALELVFVQELSHADIAQIIDCLVGTFKSQVSYALQHQNRLLI
ncbi:MAG TPA: hypothetical protein VLE70_11490 [Anaerolineae bacterium]|jgi:DNA-directed RNA polymerase specialized sigma24 family protein|nr:hypothetical protein [Anaerolineae bacterium]